MKYDTMQCEIIYRKQPAPGIHDWIVDAEDFARAAKPGQFVHVLVPGKTLRRPISICDIDAENGTLRLVFQERGEGTAMLGQKRLGDFVDLLAPLGNGFELGDTRRRALFVGGGIGVPPLLAAARPFGQNATVILGFRNQESVILARDFALAGCRVFIATDDGSMGFHGTVADCARQYASETDVLFACGPKPMLKALGALAEEQNIPAQFSLEERMACGVGACLGCACKILRDGKEVYGHVCKDGPVFDSRSIVWEE
ncbi:MAG: dihydroorotate dehydrogenase electron transfer subunit [Clostridium sp.]|nr:dihydroorotate dehydrogenase electron transfer subunit [Clostridium sp.]